MKHVTFFQAAGQRDDQRIGAALPKLFANAPCTLALLLLLLLLLMMLLLLLPLLLLPLTGVRILPLSSTTCALRSPFFLLRLRSLSGDDIAVSVTAFMRARAVVPSHGGASACAVASIYL